MLTETKNLAKVSNVLAKTFLKMRIVWIDKEGKIHEGGNHLEIAERLFPGSSNPERSCEKLNYIKLGVNWAGSLYMLVEHSDKITQAQRNTIEKLWEEHYGNLERTRMV